MEDASQCSGRSIDDEDLDHENTMSILVATDNHIGYMEKDPERGSDSLVTFEEILKIAQEKKVDFILLGGDLFHENKPSRKIVHKTMELLRKYCMGDRPCYLEFLSDQSINFSANSFPTVNYEDPNYNISIPVFSIHGNHDDPAGDGNLCSLNLFSVSGLVNYFGKANNVDDITISPLLMQKGTTKLALYGLGSVRDERLHRTFLNKKVKMLRPKEDADSWFNIFVLHQNRVKHGPKNHIPENFLDAFLDLVIWGHEHECLIDPQYSTESDKDIFISQPGSSVATSLCEGESRQKYVGILRIAGKKFRMDKFLLKTVRPFYMKDVILNETDLDPADDTAVQEYLAEQVKEFIELSQREHSGDKRQPKLPLIRLRVEYTGGFSPFNVNRFGQQFVKRVANIKDILTFFRKRVSTVRDKKSDDNGPVRIRPEILDDVRVEDLVNEYLNSQENKLQLSILSGRKMGLALQEFVDKDEKDAIGEIVKLQLRDTQKTLSTKNIRDEDIVKEVIKETERSRAEEPSQEEEARTRKDLQEAVRQSQSKSQVESVTLSDDSDGETKNQNTKPTRGRGRGRGRGKGSRTTSQGSTRGKKQQIVFGSDDGILSLEKESRSNSSRSLWDENSNSIEEEEDPFAFPSNSKRQRR